MSRISERWVAWLGDAARRPRARWVLGALSFAESSFFPIPPDVMLAPMVLARPNHAYPLAAWTTATSVLGGLVGFALGSLALENVTPVLQQLGYWDAFRVAQRGFVRWGFWAVLAAGFSPIPYKVFTLAAGALSMSLPAFVAASAIGRGARFFLVAGLAAWGGSRTVPYLRRRIDRFGWALVGLGIALFLAWRR